MKIKLTESQFSLIIKEMRFDGKSTGLFAEEEINEYFTDPYLTTDPENKWDRLEKDVESCIYDIIETHKNDFGYDSYGVIDAVYQVMDKMFPKV
jgi:predicted enzyme involved in methoxymalonyl-ACP biosynthesis|tara:strand:+ start:478 stop:759 length:282 start_codon:yes stop_codon:yes gene_type:complete